MRLLAVIVLYRIVPEQSASFRTLQAAIAELGEQGRRIQILLFDNSPTPAETGPLPDNVRYYAAKKNLGVAGAYNYALRLSRQQQIGWLLTLDQDTHLPPDFLTKILEIARRLETVHEAGAIVPHLLHRDRLLSPVRIRPWGVTYLSRESAGFERGEIHAFNSGSLFRVGALQQIGGFDPRFWLDYQDAYIFRSLYRCGRRVYIAEDLDVDHDLSLLSEQRDMSEDRFRNFLQAESAACDLYRGRIGGVALTARLLGRFWRQKRNGTDRAIRESTKKALLRRIFQSRARRIQEWTSEMQRFMPQPGVGSAGEEMPETRPSISVCMAAYNGERYITAQLQSILRQLGEDDEVVVVDDASSDNTRERVRELGDKRIRLIEHSRNQGVLRTFEDAIRAATGRLLFLSDQDDLWNPCKVAKIIDAFRSHPDVTLIATDVSLIDSNGSLISPSCFAGRKFRPGVWANLVRNQFGGCTMAFRSQVIVDILPMPYNYDVLHDVWMGVRNSLSGHRTLYIPEALVLNRRHATTATGLRALTPWRRIRVRLHLLLALAEFWIRRMVF